MNLKTNFIPNQTNKHSIIIMTKHKRLLGAGLLLVATAANVCAQDVRVHLDEAGTLESKIDKSKFDQIKSLTISGYINGTDLYDIRNMDNLETLDLSDATILASGSFGTSTYTENNTVRNGNFSNCEVRTLVLPNSLLYVKNQAFYQAYNLEKIVIGDQLVSFSYEAFVNPQNAYGHSINTCDRMREFVVSENNKNFAAPDGVLYDKAMTTLLSYPNMKAKKYTVPEGVKTIGGKAFSCCDNLYEITLPQSLEKVEGSAFESCEHLLSITCHSMTPPQTTEGLNGGVFYNVPTGSCILYVPKGTYSDYWMAPGWGRFSNIVEMEPSAIGANRQTGAAAHSVDGGIEISGLEHGETAEIYSAGGVKLYCGGNGTAKLPTGTYILKARDLSAKLTVK